MEKNGFCRHLRYNTRHRDMYTKRNEHTKESLSDTLLSRSGCCPGRSAPAEDAEKDQED